MRVRKKITLLSRYESKNGSKWLDVYRDDTFRETKYYYNTGNGGESFTDKVQCGNAVIAQIKKIGGLKKVDITGGTEYDED